MRKTNYAKLTGNTRRKSGEVTLTPQTQPIAGREAEMHENSAGGYSFNLKNLHQVKRFLCLGTEGGSYYQTEQDLAKVNYEATKAAIQENPLEVLDLVVDVIKNGRSHKQEAPLFVLALLASYGLEHDYEKQIAETSKKLKELEAKPTTGKTTRSTKLKDKDVSRGLTLTKLTREFEELKAKNAAAIKVRSQALDQINTLIKIPTNLFTFVNYAQSLRGWGRGLSSAIAGWYLSADLNRLAMHAWKYKQRDGWSNRDLIRLTHPHAEKGSVRQQVFEYMLKGSEAEFLKAPTPVRKGRKKVAEVEAEAPLNQIKAAEELLHLAQDGKVNAAKVSKAVKLIEDHRLTHEAVPGELKNSPEVWEALLQEMPLIATLRNLGKMTNIGLISPLSDAEKLVVDRLGNVDQIRRSKAHPMQFLLALYQYKAGHGKLGKLSWNPSRNVVDALDEAFYASFGNVVPTGKKLLLAVDTSGSMGVEAGNTGQSCSTMGAAMAFITLKTEKNSHVIAFGDRYIDFDYSRKTRVDDFTRSLPGGGGTDTAMPFRYLLDKSMDVDAVVSYTDNECWGASSMGWNRGRGHVTELQDQYRKKNRKDAKFVNVAMVANSHSDIDPKKDYCLELVGLDASTPTVISQFILGEI